MRGICGFIDHNFVLRELLAYARKEMKTLQNVAHFFTLLMPSALLVMIGALQFFHFINK
jgi:hypothetical protein